MIKRSSLGKARDILVACCKRKEGNGIWFIARELMRLYSTIRGWLVRMVRRGLGGRFDRKSTGRKKILNPQTLKKIMGWTRRDPSRYGFGPASWRLDMVNEMTRRETGRHARPRTLQKILRHLDLSYSKPRPVPRKTAPAEEQDMFKERVKRTILGMSGHGYAVLAVEEAGVMHGTSPGYRWRQAKSRDEARTGFSTKAARLFEALGRNRIHVKAVERTALVKIVDHDQIQSIHAFQITKNEQCRAALSRSAPIPIPLQSKCVKERPNRRNRGLHGTARTASSRTTFAEMDNTLLPLSS